MSAYSGLPVGVFPKEVSETEISVGPEKISFHRKRDDPNIYPY